MSLISAEELPTPIAGPLAGPIAVAPTAPATPVTGGWRTNRRTIGRLAVGGVAAVVAALFAANGLRSDNTVAGPSVNTQPTAGVDEGSAGNATWTTAGLDQAYGAVFGVTAAPATLDCLSAAIADQGEQVTRLANGEALNLDEATAAFTPFVACAPDQDFLYLMVPATFQALAVPADQSCIESNLVSFAVSDRAYARALAYSDVSGEFASTLASYFSPCII